MNTKFRYNLSDAWAVAHSHGHSAFRLLRIVEETEAKYDDLQAELPNLEHGGFQYLACTSKCQSLTDDMLKIASASVAAFQAMMEGLINNAIASESALASVKASLTNKKGEWERSDFHKKWTQSLVQLRRSTSEFESYYENIYKQFRIPLIHPHNANLADIDRLDFAILRAGYRDGWKASAHLHGGLGKSYDPNSWETMCNVYHITESTNVIRHH